MDKAKLFQVIDEHLQEELSLPETEGLRRQEIVRLRLIYRFLPKREYSKDDFIVSSTLIELELSGRTAFYFIAPQGGGLVTSIDGQPVQVITPQSPLGEALMGKKVGDLVQVETRGKYRTYKVISIQ